MQQAQFPAKVALRFPFATMAVWATIYYLMRDLFSRPSDDHLFHRDREHLLRLVLGWVSHMIGRRLAQVLEFPSRASLRQNPGYILVPLQVANDSQLRNAAQGWTTQRLINACIEAIAATGSKETIVFKLHPLERGSAEIKRMIQLKAAQHKLDPRHVRILESGRMGDLAQNSSGMIVINSTSAFSALHHNVPVLVLGKAVFRHKEIVTPGEVEADIGAFLKLRRSKSRHLIEAFLADVKAESLIPGDFYVATGRRAAISGIVNQLKMHAQMSFSATGASK